MIALYDFEPRFCPYCGVPAAHLRGSRRGVFQFLLRKTVSCDCGLRYERVKTDSLLAASASSEGDLPSPSARDDGSRERKAS